MGEGIAGSVAQTGKSMNIPDAYACKKFNPSIDRATNFVTKSVLCCPIADISGKHVAVVQVRRPDFARREAILVYQSFAKRACCSRGIFVCLWTFSSCGSTAAAIYNKPCRPQQCSNA